MAIYQFIFNLEFITCEDERSEICFSSQTFNLLTTELPYNKSWSEEIILYGKEDESCVEFFLNQSKVVDITVKIDLRNLSINLINTISEFCYVNNLYIDYEGRKYEPTKETLITLIKSSCAYKFMKNPKEFLNSIE